MQSQETPLDVEAILAILSQHANSASTPGVPGPTPQAQSAGAGGLPVGQNDAHASQWGASTTALPVPVPQQSVHDPRLRPQSRTATASPSPTIDPATITTWQEGMRCVTKIIAQNARFGDSIKKMIADQQKHETKWYSERQALKQSLANRKSASAQAASILQSLGSAQTYTGIEATEEDDQVELEKYDRGLYSAQTAMEEAMTAELKALGVPFFGTSADLVISNEQGESKTKTLQLEARPKWSPLVTEAELMGLRRDMVKHLELLYKN